MHASTSIELRPGVRRPDWSAVTSPAAREALLSRGRLRSGLAARWSTGLTQDEDLAWRTVIELFAHLGRAPCLADIAGAMDTDEGKLTPLLRGLQARDVLAMDENGVILYAYPFAARATGHRVELQGRRLNALCAIDALGAGAMYRRDASIESLCRWCRTGVHIITAQSGKVVSAATPAGSVVWYDYAYDESAAASCCPVIDFFCADDHLRQWLLQQVPARDGCRLTLDEALELGRAIFAPVLSRARSF